jgi:DNA-binding beta-propeller fold protein YncE
VKYTNDGTFVTKIGKAGVSYGTGTVLWCLNDVAVDSSGNTWVVASGDHIAKFDAAGKLIREWGRIWNPGAGNDRFNNARSIAFDGAGNFYVSDAGNHRIQIFDTSGNYMTTIGVTGVSGVDNGHFNRPGHIAIDNNRRLYVADTGNHRVQIFDVSSTSTITYLATIGMSGVLGDDNTHLNSPTGVAVDPVRGRIYVADARNWRIQVFDYISRAYQTTLAGFSFVEDVAVDSSGNLYVSEPWSDRHQVQQFDSSLTRKRTFGVTGVPYITDASHYF